MEERPVCKCHGEPMRLRKDGYWRCAVKHREATSRWKAENPEKVREANSRYYVARSRTKHGTPEYRLKVSAAANHMWKGDDVGYNSVHMWLLRNYPKTGVCETCGNEGKTEYAYTGNDPRGFERNRDRYRELCVPHHRVMDAWIARLASFGIKFIRA